MADQIKANLFKKYRPADYFIIPGSETTVGRSEVKYRVQSPNEEEWYEITLKRAGDRVDIAASAYQDRTVHTRFLATVGLQDVDESVYACVKRLRRDDALRSLRRRVDSNE